MYSGKGDLLVATSAIIAGSAALRGPVYSAISNIDANAGGRVVNVNNNVDDGAVGSSKTSAISGKINFSCIISEFV
jgi:hypothetical protein